MLGETGQIAHPPILYSKQQNGLHPGLVQVITPDAAFQNECLKIANFSLLQQETLLFDLLVPEQSMKEVEFFFSQLDVFGDKPVDGFEHGLIFNEFREEKIKFAKIYRMV